MYVGVQTTNNNATKHQKQLVHMANQESHQPKAFEIMMHKKIVLMVLLRESQASIEVPFFL